MAVFAGGCGASRPAARATAEVVPAAAAAPARVRSNILREDYAGSERCAGCHSDITAEWRSSAMHLMTRLPEGARILAPFDGTTFHFKDDAARMSEKDGARFVELTSPTGGAHLYRVTRVIGGRYREDFAGVEVGAAPGPGLPNADGRELILPISYVFETRSYRLKGYSVLVMERPGLHAGGVWTETCVFCHNTVPYFDDIWGALYGRGAPGYQGEVVDKLLPPERRFRFEIAGGGAQALSDAVDAEVTAVGGTPDPGARPPETLKRGIHELRARFAARHFVEVGIGCEACHGGSRAHADDPRVLPDFAPRSTFLDARPEVARADGEVTRAERINRVCARCHQVLFSRYPFTWEGGQRRADSAGGSSITSGEGRDFLLGGCAREMSCVTCHDPHLGGERPDLDPVSRRRIEEVKSGGGRSDFPRDAMPDGNGVCVRCHGRYESTAALAAHSHHNPEGAGASCIGCHMPRKNMGLGYTLTRYHRIGLPDDPVRVERDRPIECALCHATKTVGDLASTMEAWWGRRYDRAALTALYGSLDARPLQATLARGKAHEQAVALATLGEAHVTEATPAVARQLVNPYPLVRYYARRALEELDDDACRVNLDRPTSEIAADVSACVQGAFPAGPPAGGGQAPTGSEVPDED